MAITVVELDEDIIDLAWRWFGLEKKNEKIQIVTMDGVKFIEKAVIKSNACFMIFFESERRTSIGIEFVWVVWVLNI